MPSNGEGGNNGEGDDVEYAPKQIVISISNENYCYRKGDDFERKEIEIGNSMKV